MIVRRARTSAGCLKAQSWLVVCAIVVAEIAGSRSAAARVAPKTSPSARASCAVHNAAAQIRDHAIPPEYPDLARDQGGKGRVEVRVMLDAAGAVVGTSIYKSSGNVALDQSVIRAASATAYTPQIVNCVKTTGSYLFQADFN